MRALFLDRDGTVIKEQGYINSPEFIRFKKGVIKGLQALQEHFYLFIVTNQSGVKRGWLSFDRMNSINRTLRLYLAWNKIFLKDIFFCPHHPKERCGCRKPAVYMIKRILKSYPDIEISKSFVIGDKLTDIVLARNVGATGILLGETPDRVLQFSSFYGITSYLLHQL